jgi:hypothetical protein
MRGELQKACAAPTWATMRRLTWVAQAFLALASCSKSPPEAVGVAAENVGQRLMQPLVQKDASAQARRMTEVLSDKPECEVFKQRMREAGKGSPYEATTQRQFVQAQQDACAAGCCK